MSTDNDVTGAHVDAFDRHTATTVRGGVATLTFGLVAIAMPVPHVVDVAAVIAARALDIGAWTLLTLLSALLPRVVGVVVIIVGVGVLSVQQGELVLPLVACGLGFVLAVLMQRGKPSGVERDARILLQSSSLCAGVLAILLVASASPPLLPTVCSTSLAEGDVAGVLAFIGFSTAVVGGSYVAHCVSHLVAGGGTADPFDPPLVRCVTGPYAHARHPMQHGQMAVIVGLAMMVGCLGAALAALLIVIALIGPVRARERRQLAARFAA